MFNFYFIKKIQLNDLVTLT